jgi:hypothetical protein
MPSGETDLLAKPKEQRWSELSLIRGYLCVSSDLPGGGGRRILSSRQPELHSETLSQKSKGWGRGLPSMCKVVGSMPSPAPQKKKKGREGEGKEGGGTR